MLRNKAKESRLIDKAKRQSERVRWLGEYVIARKGREAADQVWARYGASRRDG